MSAYGKAAHRPTMAWGRGRLRGRVRVRVRVRFRVRDRVRGRVRGRPTMASTRSASSLPDSALPGSWS